MMMLRQVSSVHTVVPSKAQQDLPGNSVIENDNLNYDPFLLFEHIGPVNFEKDEAFGAADHPHKGLQVVLYMIDGSLLHDDSFSSSPYPVEISAGSLLYVFSGSGIVHYEMPISSKQETFLECFQIWINSPKEEKALNPAIKTFSRDDIPIVRNEDNMAEIRVISGSVFGVCGVLDLHPYCVLLDVTLKKTNLPSLRLNIFNEHIETALVYVFAPNQQYLTDPIISVCGKELKVGQVAVLNEQGDAVEFKLLKDILCRVLIAGAQPLKEQVVQEGPFAMCKRCEISQAFDDYSGGKFGKIAGAEERKLQNDKAMQQFRSRVSSSKRDHTNREDT